MRPATRIELSPQERAVLKAWTRQGKTEQRYAFRACVVLMASAGTSARGIAEALGARTARVSRRRTRFARQRLAGLRDAARPGRPAHYDESTQKRIPALLDTAPASGYARWNGRLLAERRGTFSTITSGGCWASTASRQHGSGTGVFPPPRSLSAKPSAG